jgi:hypothetical protein
MYIFVRITAVATILFGVLLMLAGLAGAVYGFFQNNEVTLAVNQSLEASNEMFRVVNAGYAGMILGAVAFLLGMISAALGQLLLVFVDLATHTRETNIILRGFRARNGERQAQPARERQPSYAEIESEPYQVETNG